LGSLESITPRFLKGLFQGLSTVRIRRSALAPFLWACLFISVPCYLIASLAISPICYWIFGVGSVPIAVFMIAGLFLLLFDRDRLHSEEHLERKHAMEIVEAKGQGLIVSPVDLANMVNPAPEQHKFPPPEERSLPALPEKEGVSNG